MDETIDETFEEWWGKEMCRSGGISIYLAFRGGWSKGFLESEKNGATREKLILNAIRPLVPNLNEIINKILVDEGLERI